MEQNISPSKVDVLTKAQRALPLKALFNGGRVLGRALGRFMQPFSRLEIRNFFRRRRLRVKDVSFFVELQDTLADLGELIRLAPNCVGKSTCNRILSLILLVYILDYPLYEFTKKYCRSL
jgi:hypothetical protein